MATEVYNVPTLTTQLEQPDLRNLYTEKPEQPGVLAYARYGLDSNQYPVRYEFCEFLIEGDDLNNIRLIWWTIGAADNMKREAWKVVQTLTYPD